MYLVHIFIGQAAGVIVLISLVPYLISIFKGETKPARTTYAIKSVVSTVTITSYIASGATASIWTNLVFAFTAIVIFILSIKHGIGGFAKLDIFCLVSALIGIILWISTKDPITALYISILIKLVATIPLLVKIHHHPNTENRTSWLIALAGDTLNIFAITSLVPNIFLLPVSECIISIAVVLCIYFSLPKAKKAPTGIEITIL